MLRRRRTIIQQLAAQSGLVGLWYPEKHSGDMLVDLSGKNNHGAITGATWVSNNGIWTLSYDGTDDWVDCGSDVSLGLVDAITLTAWCYGDGVNPYPRVITKAYDGYGTGGSCYQLGTRSSKVRFCVGGVFDDYSSGDDLSSGWNYIVGTYNRSEAKKYLDGQLIWTGSYSGAIRTNDSESVFIGNGIYGGGVANVNFPFDGFIGTVCIYSKALSNAEVRHNYELTRQLYKA